MGQEVPSTILYVCALYKQKKSTRTRKAKKVHHLLALQSARAATCLVYPFPGLSFQGYERESGTRHRRFMPPVAAASALKGLRGRRMWEGRRHSLRRGPRQARAYAVGFSPDGRYLSWGHTAVYTSPNRQGPLEHRFDLTQLTRLPGGLSDAPPVQALERIGTLSLALEQGGPYKHNARLHVQDGARRLSTIERGHTDGYRHSAYTFTPDGQGVLSGGLNGVLRLYALDGTLRVDLVGHSGEIKAVAVSADGRWVL